MNAMEMLSSQPWVERLGWTLLHFLWQGLAIAVLYATIRRGLPHVASPQRRYLLASAALAAMMAAPLVTWWLLQPSSSDPDAAYRIRIVPTPSASIANATGKLSPSVRDIASAPETAKFL